MKQLIISLVFLLLPAILFAQQTYVPDDNFEQALIDMGYDTYPLNDSVPTANIDTVKYLYVSEKNIADLTGIEDFEALETLYCNKNRLSNLDVTQNTSLEWLHCYNNELMNLDVTQNANLINLKCFENQISNLDVTQNTSLEWLHCYNNELMNLDVTQNANLINLRCNDNQISNLDVTRNTSLFVLYCHNNKLSSLDVTQNENLFVLKCHKNQISNLDLTQNTLLRLLDCSENLLMNLNVKNGNNTYMTSESDDGGLDARNNPNLSCIQVDDSTWSANDDKWFKDDHAVYSEDCGYTGIDFQVKDEADNISISSFPNPFSNHTTIQYTIDEPANVRINVYDNLGQEITTLVDGFQEAGEQQAIFNGDNLSPGVYYYTIRIGQQINSGKLLLIR